MTSAPEMRFGSVLAVGDGLEGALDRGLATLVDRLGGAPDLVVGFASPHHGDALDRIPALVTRALPAARLLGCTGRGVIGGGREVEDGAALGLLGARLPGVALTPFALDDDADDDCELGLGLAADARPTFLVLPDPFTSEPEALVEALDRRFPGGVVLGGLASGGQRPGDHRLFLGDQVRRTGAIGLALTGDLEVETVVAQGCRPIGAPMFATRVAGGVLHELDGRPALAAIDELRAALSPADRSLLPSALCLGVAMCPARSTYGAGDFLIRPLLGADPRCGAIAAAAALEPNAVVQFHLRDAAAAAADLAGLLAARRAPPPRGALLFSCLGRGAGLFGENDHDSRVFRDHVGDVPLAGFFCNGEIGPVQGHTFVHGYTSAFGLFRPRG